MNSIVFLIMRRMRQPLLTLVVVYAIAVLGLTLIPGQDADGNPWRMDLFHAFYFVSYMSTTIGFGEIPYAFTDGQRLWVTFTLYLTVIGWLYAIGTILTLLQDRMFQKAIAESLFAHRVRRMREPFYLVCGYGETGQALVRSFTRRGRHVVVIDVNENKINQIQLQNLPDYVPALAANAKRPSILKAAGLPQRCCLAVLAVTDDNDTNLKIAITSKLLHSSIPVIARADAKETEANMASFGTDYIVDPFETFSQYLGKAMRTPCLYLLRRWLGGEEGTVLEEPLYPPRDGPWLVCGYGRFGKAVVQRFEQEKLKTVVIEAKPDLTGDPPGRTITGIGTEADTLIQAGIRDAAGIVAGTDNDTNNLSIVMTARQLRPDIFVILRQNNNDNGELIRAVDADMVMHPSEIVAERIRILAVSPMLAEFFALAAYKENAWGCELVSRFSGMVSGQVPVVQELTLDQQHASALLDLLGEGEEITLGELMRDPWDRDRPLPCMVLLMHREREKITVPASDLAVQPGDRLLLAGARHGITRFQWNLAHNFALDYVRSGDVRPQGSLWRSLRQWRRERSERV